MRLIDADKLMQDLSDEMLAKALDMLNYDDVEYMRIRRRTCWVRSEG